jgi:predicted nucleic acid-binding protein
MPRYLVDTWFLVALVDSLDSQHRQAVDLHRRTQGALLVTHEGVLGEFLTFYSGFGTTLRRRALERVQSLRVHPQYEVAAFTALFPAAVNLYSRRPDKEYSLIDCMSMVLMEQQKITHVLTNDHHFRQEGFTVVNE